MDLKRYKKIIKLGIVELICLSILFLLPAIKICKSNKIQKEIAQQIIRFHVIANSDSIHDQEVKIKVKEAVIEDLRGQIGQANTIEEARIIIKKQLPNMQELANQILKDEGEKYSAKAQLNYRNFPVKLYGDMAFPAGTYETLQIQLGEAKGKNWWCVMFPTLCFVDGTYQVVPDESKEKLKYVLTDEEYESLLINQDIKVEPKFKLAEWWKKLRK